MEKKEAQAIYYTAYRVLPVALQVLGLPASCLWIDEND